MSDKASTDMEFPSAEEALSWLASTLTCWPQGAWIGRVRRHKGIAFRQDIESGDWVAFVGEHSFTHRHWRERLDKPFESGVREWCGCGDGYQAKTAGAEFIRQFGHCENCHAAEHGPTPNDDSSSSAGVTGSPAITAADILGNARGHLQDRAATYDKQAQGGERSIGAAVTAFQAVTGDGVMDTAERGWMFMVLLKLVRTQQGEYRADNYEDATAYAALMGEAAAGERGRG